MHHHLVREGTRLQAGLVIESGEPRDVHQFATLIGYGAAAINPYVMLETLGELVDEGWLPEAMTAEEAQKRAIKGIAKGLLKTISKMGISTIPSYCGAQIFEAIGLEPCTRRAALHRHPVADRRHRRRDRSPARRSTGTRAPIRSNGDLLPLGGVYAWRNEGEYHQWNPETIALLQHSVRHGGYETYEEFSRLVNEEAVRRATLRGLLQLPAGRTPIPLEEVEPAAEIVKRFSTGAMSLGSLVPRGARDARDRDEPARRQVEHRRGRRGSGPLHRPTRTATRAARRSSRSPRAASA